MNDLRQWFATTATNATYESHLMPATDHPGPGGSIRALCGEAHREWQAVQDFARPEVFSECTECRSIDLGLS